MVSVVHFSTCKYVDFGNNTLEAPYEWNPQIKKLNKEYDRNLRMKNQGYVVSEKVNVEVRTSNDNF